MDIFPWWSAAGAAVPAALVYIQDGSRYIEQCEHAGQRAREPVTTYAVRARGAQRTEDR
jgi:hypothetical protein